ncbi:MAG: hypothetical protein C4329_11655 [Chitinophagaceae bacterium]
MGHHISEFHVSQEKIEDILQKLFCNETIRQYESEMRCKNGSIKHVLINSTVYWEDGKFKHTRCYTIDITEKKEAERKLFESQSYYEQLLHGLPVAVYTCDATGKIHLYNDAAQKLWGRNGT